MNTIPWRVLTISALALLAVGCGSGGPRLYKVVGTVTDKGAPVAKAQVTFAYVDGNFANGSTDDAGKFELTYMNRPGGAAPGKCTVTVSKRAGVTGLATPPSASGPPKSEADRKTMQNAQQNQMQEFATKQAELDKSGGSSGDFTKTGLEVEVTTDESKNNFAIDLKDFKN